jgi:hypothetical protein
MFALHSQSTGHYLVMRKILGWLQAAYQLASHGKKESLGVFSLERISSSVLDESGGTAYVRASSLL